MRQKFLFLDFGLREFTESVTTIWRYFMMKCDACGDDFEPGTTRQTYGTCLAIVKPRANVLKRLNLFAKSQENQCFDRRSVSWCLEAKQWANCVLENSQSHRSRNHQITHYSTCCCKEYPSFQMETSVCGPSLSSEESAWVSDVRCYSLHHGTLYYI